MAAAMRFAVIGATGAKLILFTIVHLVERKCLVFADDRSTMAAARFRQYRESSQAMTMVSVF
jgi:hypothetical protein